ncbi:hypothetical protein BCR34DRAFT_497625 [Clohesyomyces aquaticus]|uniref:Uncharacterized protein n=1 Tax=Clohesyomyces aquaticus TaxID=1231657 RepID=A0A1Y1YF16_9PLEO|nr:hypothetical protein BCR34DRAFT_497625 [Clohesyomyces aquaticus]
MPYTTGPMPSSAAGYDPSEPIAVVGMAMRFPGGSTDSKRFWDMLQHGRSAHGPVPKSRFNIDGYYHPDGARTGSINIKGSYFLEEDPLCFDAPFFSMTANEANGTDGQQRLMLEVAYETLENAGIPMHSVVGSKTGVYVGCFTKDFESIGGRDPFGGPFYAATGNGQSMLSNRLSWFFDLRGPSFTIDTACSSSLYAVHLACQSLRMGETTMAIVGGTNLIYDVTYMRDMVTMTFLSPDGICHSFDHRANGYARGEGVGGICLKTVKRALADGDTIRAVIRGSGLNQDGKTPGITMPSPEAQADLIRSTYASAGLSLDKTAYFEAHGTGTAIGDPYELSALGATLGKARSSENPIFVGSVKTNIGHLEGCAGLAGLIKTVLILENGKIPPLAGFEQANPRLKLDEWNVILPERLFAWPNSGLRRASINSFGYGGANAHVIMDDAPNYLEESELQELHQTVECGFDSDETSQSSVLPAIAECSGVTGPEHKLFIFSSADQTGLQRLATIYLAFLENECDSFLCPKFIMNLAYTLASRRSFLDHRSFVVASSRLELIQQLQDGLPKRRRIAKSNNTLFIFSGQGAQWPNMGKELITYHTYRESLERSQSALLELGSPWRLIEELFAFKERSRIDSPEFSQPICTALQLALVDLLNSWGVIPKSVVGHSSGEIAAAYTAGLISHEDAMKVAYFRGVYSADVNRRRSGAHGAMMAVGLSAEACFPLMTQVPDDSVVLACINSPSSVTLSGDEDSIVELEALLNKTEVFARRLRVQTAYHSHHMQAISQDYSESLGTIIAPQAPPSGVTMFSTVTAAPVNQDDINSEYWVSNLLSPVRFSEAVRAVLTQPLNTKSRRKVFVPYSAIIECGPAEVMKGPLNQILISIDEKLVSTALYVSMLSRGQDAEVTSMKAAGRLWAQGIQVKLSEVNFPGSDSTIHKTLVDLPPYPWHHQKRYYHESSWGKTYRHLSKPRTDLLGIRLDNQNPDEPRWHNWIKLAEQPWLSDHRVQQQILYPGAAMVTMAFEAARELVDSGRTLKAVQADNIVFKRGLVISNGEDAPEVAIHLRPANNRRDSVRSWRFAVFSRPIGENWQETCTGEVSLIYVSDLDQVQAETCKWHADLDLLHRIRKRASRTIAPDTFYKLFDRKMNLQYGPWHRNVTKCIAGVGEGLGTVRIPDTKSCMPARFEYPHLIHPATLDSVFHMQALGYLHSLSGDESLIPISIASIYVAADVPTSPGAELLGYSKGAQGSSGDTVGDIVLSDDGWSSPKVVVRGFLSRDMSVSAPQSSAPDTRSKKCTWVGWVDFHFRNGPRVSLSTEGDEATGSVEQLAQVEFSQVTILYQAGASDDVLNLMSGLTKILNALSLRVKTVIYSDLTTETLPKAVDKVVISLVEAEKPAIATWDEKGFARFKSLSVHAEALLWITRGGGAITDSDLQFHVTTGLLRTIRVERPQLKLPHLDLDPETSLAMPETAVAIVDAFKASILNQARITEQEFAEIGGKLFVPRLQTQDSFHVELSRGNHQNVVEQSMESIGRHLQGAVTNGGEDIIWSDNAVFEKAIAADEVDVRIFVISLGRSSRSRDPIHGIDAAGEVIAVGAHVEDLSVGYRVVICGLNGLETHTRIHKTLVRRIPNSMSLNVATGLPSALCTAQAALIGSANLQPGETVLICAFPGVLQQILIRIATHVGARVLVTTETGSNRRILEQNFSIPGEYTFGSVLSDTTWKTLECIGAPHGVDVIVDEIGDAKEQAIAHLADFGRYIFCGKNNSTKIAIGSVRNATLAVVDIEHMKHSAPSRLAKTFSRGWELVKDGTLANFIAGEEFRVSDFKETGDYMYSEDCAGGAILILSPDDTISVLPPAPNQLKLDPKATYVLSGGLGGIGRSIAEMMFAVGARNISFLSRSGATSPEARSLLNSLQYRGCNAQAYACDITSATAVETFAESALERGETIKGVVQCAMVLRDSMFDNMTFSQWTDSLSPKVQGTWNLHRFLGTDVDFFIMLSSMAGIIGNPGQANYSAAGTYQDALSKHRRAKGMVSTTIDLGIVSDVGYIAENPEEFERLAYLENLFISERDLHLIVAAAMLGETQDGEAVPAQLVTGVGKELLIGGSVGNAMSSDLKYVHLHDASAAGGSSLDASEDEEIQTDLKAAETVIAASKIVEGVLAKNLGRALTMEKDDIDLERPIFAYGVDSLVAVEIRNMIFRSIKADVSVFDVMSNLSIAQLAVRIVGKSKLVSAEVAMEAMQE